jgi:cytochrome c oxidase subunit I+III
VAFFPMHITGLLGMPRRVHTYGDYLGWDWLNLISTIGAYLIAAAVALFLLDLARNFRVRIGGHRAGNYWNAGTLEWLPNGSYASRSIPRVGSRYPIWDQHNLADDVEAGHYYLPGAPTGTRETLVTSPVDAHPQYVMQLPGPAWEPLFAALCTALCFFALTVKLVIPALILGGLAVAGVLWWLWQDCDPPPHPPVDIGGGITLPVNLPGPMSHSWWAMIVLILVAGSVFACLIASYLFLWTVSPEVWPDATGQPLAQLGCGATGLAMLALSGAGVGLSNRMLERNSLVARMMLQLTLLIAVLFLTGAAGTEFVAQWKSGLRPADSPYAAVVYTIIGLQGFLVAVMAVMALYTIARSAAGTLSNERRVTFDNTRLLWYYTIGQGVLGLLLVHLFPRALG